MDKGRLHHIWKKLRAISFVYLLVAFVVSLSVAIVALRQNNLTAIKLRDEVLQVDKDNGNVEAALTKLRTFVYGHMNADLASGTSVYPPIQLKYRYDRLVQAEQDKAASASPQIYTDAQHYCEAQNSTDFSGRNRVPCIQDYVTSHGAPTPQPIPDSLYKFDFASPTWSPDLAGWSLLASGLLGFIVLVRLSLELWLRHQLKNTP